MKKTSGHFASALAEPKFSFYAVGQLLSQFGEYLAQIAVIAAVGHFTTRAPLAYSQITVAVALPALLFGPLVGVVIDRQPKRHVLMAADLGRACVMLSIPVVMRATGSVLMLFPLICLNYLLTLFASAGRISLVPRLVPAEKIFAANAVMDFINKLAGVCGFVGGGLLVSGLFWNRLRIEPWEAGFYVDGLAFLGAVLMIFLLKVDEQVPATRGSATIGSLWRRRMASFRADIRELLRLLRDNQPVRFVLMTLVLVAMFGGTLHPLIIVIVQKTIAGGSGVGTDRVGVLGGVLGAGMMLGALSSGFLLHRFSRRKVILSGLLGLSLMVCLFARCATFLQLVPVALLGGLCLSPVMIAQNTMLHEEAPQSLWGRLFSGRDIILDTGFMVSALALGFTAQIVLPRFGTVNHEKVTLFWAGVLLALLTAGLGLMIRHRHAAARDGDGR